MILKRCVIYHIPLPLHMSRDVGIQKQEDVQVPTCGTFMKLTSFMTQYHGPYDYFDPVKLIYHIYPLDDLPLLDLHIPPHYVICHAGKRIADHLGEDWAPACEDTGSATVKDIYGFDASLEQLDNFWLVLDIYRVWISVKVPAEFRNGTATQEESGDVDNHGGPLGINLLRDDVQHDYREGQTKYLDNDMSDGSVPYIAGEPVEYPKEDVEYDENCENDDVEDEMDIDKFYDGIERWRYDVSKKTASSDILPS